MTLAAKASAAEWLATARAAAHQPPAQARQPLWVAGQAVGSVATGILSQIDLWRLSDKRYQLLNQEHSGEWTWHLDVAPDAVTPALNLLAQALRSKTKPNNPGMWDTLMGGMVSAADTLQQALERETWEEAGLRLPELLGSEHGGQVDFSRPSREGGGVGYMVERIDWFRCTVPDGLEPRNQDGEVERFELWSPAQVRECIAAGGFTLEAALVGAPVMTVSAVGSMVPSGGLLSLTASALPSSRRARPNSRRSNEKW